MLRVAARHLSRPVSCRRRSYASLVIRRRPDQHTLGTQAETTVPFREKPKSLGLEIGSPADINHAPPPGVMGFVLRSLGYYSKEAKLIRGTRTLYDRIVEQADDEQFYHALSLEKNFRTTYAMLALHVWMSLVRLRSEPESKEAGQLVYDLFYHDVENRVVAAGVKVLISRWMKELEKNFYGAGTAYDKALLPDASPDDLPRALWRNVFAEDAREMPSGPEAIAVKALARYVRRELASLSMTDSEAFMNGAIRFSRDFGEEEQHAGV